MRESGWSKKSKSQQRIQKKGQHTETMYALCLDFSYSSQSDGINFKLQMTSDGFTLIGDEHHPFNCTAGHTDTPAALGVVLASLSLSSLLDLMFQLH